MTAHKHAANMMKYALDALETETQWELWECQSAQGGGQWRTLCQNHSWADHIEYRRRPRIININGFEVPEPCREPPEEGTEYFTPSLLGDSSGYPWHGDEADEKFLRCGIVHLTREAAEIHAKALMSFTTKKE